MGFLNLLQACFFDYGFIDQINTKHICYFYLFAGLFLTDDLFSSDPLTCWTPANYPNSWEKYINNYCYVEGTNFVKLNETYPRDFKNTQNIRFYQFFPLILIACSVFFHVPRLFWSNVHRTSRFYFAEFCNAADNPRSSKFQHALELFDHAVYSPPHPPSSLVKFFFPSSIFNFFEKYYLTFFYIVFKIWTILNIIIVQGLLSYLLIDNANDIYGVHSTIQIILGNDWKVSGLFPRVTACEVNIRKMGIIGDVIQPKKVDCILKANFFVEKFFVASSFVLIFLFIISVFNLLLWLKRLWYSKAYLEDLVTTNLSSKYDFSTLRHKAILKLFVTLFLPDGRFVFLMLKDPAAIYTAEALYISFLNNSSIGNRLYKAREEDLRSILEEYLR